MVTTPTTTNQVDDHETAKTVANVRALMRTAPPHVRRRVAEIIREFSDHYNTTTRRARREIGAPEAERVTP